VARLGGDEFTVLLEDIREEADAAVVASRIQEELSKPFRLGGQDVFTSASIGIALGSTEYTSAEELLQDADLAMYRAKALGKARHEVFDLAMRARAVALLNLETDLRRALERNEFRVHYQPIVSLETHAITGFEALLRWQHPESGLVLPEEFIQVAEETGLIAPIGAWVLREACRQTAAWQAEFRSHQPLTIAVNLSSRQFLQADLVGQVTAILGETGLDPRSLRLEITESAIIENTEHASRLLAGLKKMGVQLYIDDFGTGYSSLSYLHRFPIDALKIDRFFVRQVTSKGENLEIVRTIVALARSLGMGIVAEGVETEAQLSQLRALDCDLGQGFLFSRPLESEDATALLTGARAAAGSLASIRAGVAA
jgi:predicted signal transduction protein with EAL and GGDEF domain